MCQECDDFDLCQSCYITSTHKRSDAFALIAAEGDTPILLAKAPNAAEQAATKVPLRTNNDREPQCYSFSARRETFQSGSSNPPIPPPVKGPSKRRDDDVDSRPPNLMASSSSFSSSLSSQHANHRLNQHGAGTSSFLEMSSSSFSEHQSSSDPMPYVTECAPVATAHQNGGQGAHVLHRSVYCDGPKCRGASQCIAGPRYTCANCPPSIDLCQGCYSSQSAHNVSHSFKRYDKAGVTEFVMCPPQLQQAQQRQTRELHRSVYCDGIKCRWETQCIVGPRYTCANCSPSIDLCQACYSSCSAHNTSHSFKRFDKAGVSSFVMCPPQLHQQQEQQPRDEYPNATLYGGSARPGVDLPQANRPGGSHVGAAPPNRPPNVSQQEEQTGSDRFEQVLQNGIEVLENEQSKQEEAELHAWILEQVQKNEAAAMEHQNAILLYQQEMLNQQQMLYQQQDVVFSVETEPQILEEVQVPEFDLTEFSSFIF